jgi:hypothetical protein
MNSMMGGAMNGCEEDLKILLIEKLVIEVSGLFGCSGRQFHTKTLDACITTHKKTYHFFAFYSRYFLCFFFLD